MEGYIQFRPDHLFRQSILDSRSQNLYHSQVDMNFSIPNVSLVGALSICAYLTSLCSTSPNPDSTLPKVKDNIRFFTDIATKSSRYVYFLLWLYHSMFILFPEDRSSFCPNADILNQDLFAWSNTSVAFVIAILIAAPIRLLAYAQLGKNFTFGLDKPKSIIQTGMYAYVQHPSYTTFIMIQAAGFFFWLKLDGVASCFLPTMMTRINGLSEVTALAQIVIMCVVLRVRVRDEEAMLRDEFGKEWIEYHSKTKRFIPGIL
jgi:protein-S-isoprenylcysteine O-methyltransferase Ste14